MAKVEINGEVFEWDRSVRLLSEALFVERVLQCNFAVWEDELDAQLKAGSMKHMAMLLALVLRRAGHDIADEDARKGTFQVAGKGVDIWGLRFIADEGDTDPTSPPPADSSTTGDGTSGSSPSA